MEKNITPVKEKEVLNDYEATPVPDSEHMSWLSQGAVWIGASFCLAAIQTGGILANGLSFGQSIIAILVGSAILTVLAIYYKSVTRYFYINFILFGIRYKTTIIFLIFII